MQGGKITKIHCFFVTSLKKKGKNKKLHSPQSLFGAEEVKARFLHVHLNDNNPTESWALEKCK